MELSPYLVAWHVLTDKNGKETFKKVLEDGYLKSAAKRGKFAYLGQRHNPAVYNTDALAGDHHNIFLALIPYENKNYPFPQLEGRLEHLNRSTWGFGFNVERLINDGAQVGKFDLLDTYDAEIRTILPDTRILSEREMGKKKQVVQITTADENLRALFQQASKDYDASKISRQKWLKIRNAYRKSRKISKLTFPEFKEQKPAEAAQVLKALENVKAKYRFSGDKARKLIENKFKKCITSRDPRFEECFNLGSLEIIVKDELDVKQADYFIVDGIIYDKAEFYSFDDVDALIADAQIRKKMYKANRPENSNRRSLVKYKKFKKMKSKAYGFKKKKLISKRKNPTDDRLRKIKRSGDDPVRELLEKQRAGLVATNLIKFAAKVGHPVAIQIYPELFKAPDGENITALRALVTDAGLVKVTFQTVFEQLVRNCPASNEPNKGLVNEMMLLLEAWFKSKDFILPTYNRSRFVMMIREFRESAEANLDYNNSLTFGNFIVSLLDITDTWPAINPILANHDLYTALAHSLSCKALNSRGEFTRSTMQEEFKTLADDLMKCSGRAGWGIELPDFLKRNPTDDRLRLAQHRNDPVEILRESLRTGKITSKDIQRAMCLDYAPAKLLGIALQLHSSCYWSAHFSSFYKLLRTDFSKKIAYDCITEIEEIRLTFKKPQPNQEGLLPTETKLDGYLKNAKDIFQELSQSKAANTIWRSVLVLEYCQRAIWAWNDNSLDSQVSGVEEYTEWLRQKLLSYILKQPIEAFKNSDERVSVAKYLGDMARNPTDDRLRKAQRGGDRIEMLLAHKRATGEPTDEALQIAADLGDEEIIQKLGIQPAQGVLKDTLQLVAIANAVKFLIFNNKDQELIALAIQTMSEDLYNSPLVSGPTYEAMNNSLILLAEMNDQKRPFDREELDEYWNLGWLGSYFEEHYSRLINALSAVWSNDYMGTLYTMDIMDEDHPKLTTAGLRCMQELNKFFFKLRRGYSHIANTRMREGLINLVLEY